MAKEILISHQGLKALEQELDELKTFKRKEIAEKIKVALSFGDLSENSEYDSAKNEQAIMEARIAQLESMLANAKTIDVNEVTTDKVSIGCTVEVEDVNSGDKDRYSIVSQSESDVFAGKISDESPVGAGLIGKTVGDVAEVELPTGAVLKLRVLQIEKAQL